MLGTISDQKVSRISPGTMISAKPIAMPIPARMDAAITTAQERQHGRHGLAQVQVGPAVPHVLYRLDEGRLDQEGGDHADEPADERAEADPASESSATIAAATR